MLRDVPSNRGASLACLQLFAWKGIDEAARGDVPDGGTDYVGITLDVVVGLKRHIEAVDDLMQRIVGVFAADTLPFFVVVGIEMGLDGNHVVFIVDRECLHPRVVGSGHIDGLVAGV